MDSDRPTIYMVDDDLVNLSFGSGVLASKYNVATANSGARLFNMLDKHIPDLILLDIEMPVLNGYETIKLLKEKDTTKNIPVIFLTAKNDDFNELKGLSLGAVDYIGKPLSYPILLQRIEGHLLIERQKHELEIQKLELTKFNNNLMGLVESKSNVIAEMQEVIMKAFTGPLESRDLITAGHNGRTQEFYKIMIEDMRVRARYKKEIETWDTAYVIQSARLHDIGKIAIRDSILMKKDKLTPDEYEIIKTHVALGDGLIVQAMSQSSSVTILEYARIMVLTHHERWDGAGYPNGLKGGEIPLQGRIMAIVDVYDALTSDRPYKKKICHENAVKIIAAGRGGQFDPDLVDIFLVMGEFFKLISISHIETPRDDIFPN